MNAAAVLYLLHGSGDNESTWTKFGRANVILDNLIVLAPQLFSTQP